VGCDLGELLFEEGLSELVSLASTAGLVAANTLISRRKAPDAATYIGSGKLQELAVLCQQHHPQTVVFSVALSPIQQRNLERALNVKVIDRTGLILDIFAQRAKSHEGKLQVELAQVQYQATRLVRQWSHLERQRGGIGVRGGPGERQLELDKRMLATKEKSLKLRLQKVARQRDTQRRARLRSGQLRVSIVGYTNAGKSTLFNALVGADSYAADQLFATLDTTTRRLKLRPGAEVAISDTVGFVRDLPHQLVAAFKSTLAEATEADLLLHVVDVGSPVRDEQIAAVNDVLREIGAAHITQWLVFNKIDAAGMAATEPAPMHHPDYGDGLVLYLSARTGEGVPALRIALADHADGPAKAEGSPEMPQSALVSIEMGRLAPHLHD
jgi:GTPase